MKNLLFLLTLSLAIQTVLAQTYDYSAIVNAAEEKNKPKEYIEYYENGDIKYKGNYKNDKYNGEGTYYFKDGSKYVGNFKDNQLVGQGTFYFIDGRKYVGNWEDNKYNGKGTFYYADGNKKYEGQFKNDKFEGVGTYYFKDGRKYVGNWKDNKYNGEGTFYYADGNKRYEGNYKNDKCEGEGTYYFKDGSKYIGKYEKGKYNGEGTYYLANGDIEYKGNYKDDKRDGNGIMYYSNGNKFEGSFQAGEINNGIIYDTNDNKISEVINGEIVSEKNFKKEKEAKAEKRIQDRWNEESAANDTYFASIDNSSVAESIASNPIRTIKENDVEIVIDFSKASKETVNFFLVRPEQEKSKELKNIYIYDLLETDGGKVSHKILGDGEKVKLKAIYDGQIITITDYQEDGSYTQSKYQNRNKIGILQKYDKNGNRLKSEETAADISKFLSQKNFYIPAMMSRNKNIEISDGIWKITYEGRDQYTSSQYSYKQLNDTQIELTFLESNDSFNEYKKGDKFIVELLFMNLKSKFYKLTITPLNTSYTGSLEEYSYN